MKRRKLSGDLPKDGKTPEFVEAMKRMNHTSTGVLEIFNTP